MFSKIPKNMTTPEGNFSTNTKGEGFDHLLLELDRHGHLYKVDYSKILFNKGGGVSSHSWKPRLTLSLCNTTVYQFTRTKANYVCFLPEVFASLAEKGQQPAVSVNSL